MVEIKTQRLDSYMQLIDISRDLASTLDLDVLLDRIVKAAADITSAEAASILLYDNTARQLYGEALIVNDHLEEGAALWKKVNNKQGQLKYREFWYEHISDQKRLGNIRVAMDS